MLLGNLGDRYGARNILALNLVMSALSMVRTMNITILKNILSLIRPYSKLYTVFLNDILGSVTRSKSIVSIHFLKASLIMNKCFYSIYSTIDRYYVVIKIVLLAILFYLHLVCR